jgi:hypothetical protein
MVRYAVRNQVLRERQCLGGFCVLRESLRDVTLCGIYIMLLDQDRFVMKWDIKIL